MPRHEAIDRRFQKPDPFPVPEHEPPADQPALAPAIDSLGRDLEAPADILDRQDLFRQAFGLDVRAV
jgi:hypothetical protein